MLRLVAQVVFSCWNSLLENFATMLIRIVYNSFRSYLRCLSLDQFHMALALDCFDVVLVIHLVKDGVAVVEDGIIRIY